MSAADALINAATALIITGHIDTDTGWWGHTPGGVQYGMRVRPGTSDWNTVNACGYPNDEYHIPKLLGGWGLDVGAHIGAATIPLLLDNPTMQVIAIEALPENAELLAENALRNLVGERLTIIQGGASDDHARILMHYAPDDAQHQFIGNTWGPQDRPAISVPGVTLADCLRMTDGWPFSWAKLDCEGCEYPFLSAPPDQLRMLAHIEGEVHLGWQRLVDLLSPTHYLQGGADFGAFVANVKPMTMEAAQDFTTGEQP